MKHGSSHSPAVPPPDREVMVREAAYFRFQANGCQYGHALEDWLAAEAQVDHVLREADSARRRPAPGKTTGP